MLDGCCLSLEVDCAGGTLDEDEGRLDLCLLEDLFDPAVPEEPADPGLAWLLFARDEEAVSKAFMMACSCVAPVSCSTGPISGCLDSSERRLPRDDAVCCWSSA